MKRTDTKSRSLARIRIEKETYSIRATRHAIDRMEERGVDEWVVSGNILALGKEKLLEFQEKKKDIALIDEKRNIAIVMNFERNTIKILTVIDRSDIYVFDGTVVECI